MSGCDRTDSAATARLAPRSRGCRLTSRSRATSEWRQSQFEPRRVFALDCHL